MRVGYFYYKSAIFFLLNVVFLFSMTTSNSCFEETKVEAISGESQDLSSYFVPVISLTFSVSSFLCLL